MNKTKFNDFINYVLDFYNPTDGVYPVQDLTLNDVMSATYIVIGKCAVANRPFEGDSFDREWVRDILTSVFNYKFD